MLSGCECVRMRKNEKQRDKAKVNITRYKTADTKHIKKSKKINLKKKPLRRIHIRYCSYFVYWHRRAFTHLLHSYSVRHNVHMSAKIKIKNKKIKQQILLYSEMTLENSMSSISSVFTTIRNFQVDRRFFVLVTFFTTFDIFCFLNKFSVFTYKMKEEIKSIEHNSFFFS